MPGGALQSFFQPRARIPHGARQPDAMTGAGDGLAQDRINDA
jgi:hypothetical protein